ncbi:hydrolase [Bacillus sp. USDA818B3_A]|uniref:hydrolase n=1 Tax=Bacillus sp. USDA818B3_A TaxID=2698834 RepID=UPI0013702683|nr:hydrolase [Bacillus sp. USDA818B3_A]
MAEPRQSYYINIQSHEIFSEPNVEEWDFKIEATTSQAAVLERLFDKTDETDWESYFRAHVPYLEYHHQPQNKEYDLRMLLIYKFLYYLGDEKTRGHICEMGILNEEEVQEQSILGYREF